MFFGLTNSPATFQTMMNDLFHKEILEGWLYYYMDDILIANEGDREDLARKGITTLDKLEEKELFVRASKSAFFVTEIDFLGFWLSKGKLSMEQQKVSGIMDWPLPEIVTKVKSVLRFC